MLQISLCSFSRAVLAEEPNSEKKVNKITAAKTVNFIVGLAEKPCNHLDKLNISENLTIQQKKADFIPQSSHVFSYHSILQLRII